MGCSPQHPPVWYSRSVARGRAGPSRTVVPLLVGCDAPDEFPAGRQHPLGLSPCGVSSMRVTQQETTSKGHVLAGVTLVGSHPCWCAHDPLPLRHLEAPWSWWPIHFEARRWGCALHQDDALPTCPSAGKRTGVIYQLARLLATHGAEGAERLVASPWRASPFVPSPQPAPHV
jgi:hypothetical protein